jgi:hypothetical protein
MDDVMFKKMLKIIKAAGDLSVAAREVIGNSRDMDKLDKNLSEMEKALVAYEEIILEDF